MSNPPLSPASNPQNIPPQILRRQVNWENLHFYQKSKSLYSITYYFTQHFLKKGDRTIDQMLQAARSGKQNIVEGSADGVTSSEMELKLLNVSRASFKELLEDYEDYLRVRNLSQWTSSHTSYDEMLRYCREHNQPSDYESLLPKQSDEAMANMAITLLHMVDRMMMSYQRRLEKRFLEEGGIRERMTAARLSYRTQQREYVQKLERQIEFMKNKLSQYQEAPLPPVPPPPTPPVEEQA